MQRYKKISKNASVFGSFLGFFCRKKVKNRGLMSQCHANITCNYLIISECCNVALIALKIKFT